MCRCSLSQENIKFSLVTYHVAKHCLGCGAVLIQDSSWPVSTCHLRRLATGVSS